MIFWTARPRRVCGARRHQGRVGQTPRTQPANWARRWAIRRPTRTSSRRSSPAARSPGIRAKNTFTTQPANLASALSGLQVPGQKTPAGSVSSGGGMACAGLAPVVVAGRYPGAAADRAWRCWWPRPWRRRRAARREPRPPRLRRLVRVRLRGRHRVCPAMVAGCRRRSRVVELVRRLPAAASDRAPAQSAGQRLDATGACRTWSTSCWTTNPKRPAEFSGFARLRPAMPTRTSSRTCRRRLRRRHSTKIPTTWTRLRPGFHRRAKSRGGRHAAADAER